VAERLPSPLALESFNRNALTEAAPLSVPLRSGAPPLSPRASFGEVHRCGEIEPLVGGCATEGLLHGILADCAALAAAANAFGLSVRERDFA
jgi:hypothetical protein